MKKVNKKISGTALVIGLSLMGLSACNNPGINASPKKQLVRGDQLVDGESWKANLTSVNGRFGAGSGTAAFKIEGGKLIAQVETSGLKEVSHVQTIRSGSCPVESADTNADGFIDGAESVAAQDSIVLALDGDLSSADAGADGYPKSDMTGNYLYSETADQSVLANQDLNGKIVLIHGIATTEVLPATVKGLGNGDIFATMPVLCGKITKETSTDGGNTTGGNTGDQGQQQQRPQQQQQWALDD